jgi:hypothetical protein
MQGIRGKAEWWERAENFSNGQLMVLVLTEKLYTIPSSF